MNKFRYVRHDSNGKSELINIEHISRIDEEKQMIGMVSGEWNSKYKGEPTIPLSVIEKITTEIEERATYEGIYLDRADVLDIIDKAVKEYTHEPT